MIAHLRKIYLLIRNRIKDSFFLLYRNVGGLEQVDLLIYDDVFPHPVSGFRYEEFTVLLNEFQESRIALDPRSYRKMNSPRNLHKEHLSAALKENPNLKGKVIPHRYLCQPRLFYCVFLSNIFRNLEWLEKYQIPFVFTLYPGGGFVVDHPETDKKLFRVLSSPLFRKVIVTQQYTKDYIINKSFCEKEKIEFIFGGVVPQKSLLSSNTERKQYLQNKETFDIAFCAAKYTPKGQDKGYDEFIEFARNIAEKYDFVRFHVIGGFDKEVLDVKSIEDKINFYGFLDFDELRTVFNLTDVIVSPNKPFKLRAGAFDGFPLGTVVEACLNGVVAIVSDELKQNKVFEPHEEIILIEPESRSIEKAVFRLINEPERIKLISKKARKKFSHVYSNDVQMIPRVNLLRKEISKTKSTQ